MSEKWPNIRGFVRVTNSKIEGCSYFRNNGFGTIDQIAVKRDNIRIIGAEDYNKPVWRVFLVANIEGKFRTLEIDETIFELAEQMNEVAV